MTPEEISNHSADISLTDVVQDQNNRFCELWPNVKQGLVLLRDIIKNPIAKAAISVVIGAGDAVASQICGRPNAAG